MRVIMGLVVVGVLSVGSRIPGWLLGLYGIA